jgi:hypothetical protein
MELIIHKEPMDATTTLKDLFHTLQISITGF